MARELNTPAPIYLLCVTIAIGIRIRLRRGGYARQPTVVPWIDPSHAPRSGARANLDRRRCPQTAEKAPPIQFGECLLPMSDRDWACCVLGEGRQITQAAGEHDGAGADAGECGYDSVGCGDRRGPTGGGAQPRRLAGLRLGHVPDLAGAQQPVGVEVAAVISGERLGQDDRGNLSGPPAARA
jgi:hypothetical protein